MYQYFYQSFTKSSICFWGISNNTVFTTLTTIGILLLGYIANKRFENWKENKRLTDFKKYFINYLKSLLPKIDKQILEYKNLSETITLNERKDLAFGESLGSSLIGFKNLPFNDIYKIFISNFKNKDTEKYVMYNNLIDCLNFFDRQIEYAQRNFNEYLSKYNQYVYNWEEYGDMILRKQDEFVSLANRTDINAKEDEFLNNFVEIVHNWHQNKDCANIDIFETVFIEPLRKLCTGNIIDPRSITLLNYITKSSRAIVKIKHIKELYSEYYSNEEKHLNEKRESVIKALKYFE